ncbi:MAG: hypothetical protein DLM57_00160 [Pseudonocardiales bacterium]|nr:MAG: hypothetical protein DLM57_00160 [Pseudonocardiales bacterium]
MGAGERLTAPLTIEPISTTALRGGTVAHVFARIPDRTSTTVVRTHTPSSTCARNPLAQGACDGEQR